MKHYFLTNKYKQKGGVKLLLDNETFNRIYQNYDNSQVSHNLNNDLVATTYGEIKPEGVQNIINELNITNKDIFYDLGSGLGKVIMQFYINTPIEQAIGVEFYKERHNQAEKALLKLYKEFPNELDNDRIITYQHQNIKDVDLSDATIIFMCSTCYSNDLLDVIFNKIKDNKNIKYIISLKTYDKFKEICPKTKKINIPCTWNSNNSCTIYHKN